MSRFCFHIVGALMALTLAAAESPSAGAVTAKAPGTAREPVTFIDVTAPAGVGTRPSVGGGLASGSAWGDFDSDGFPDLFVGNHYDTPALFRNLGNGTFANVTSRVMVRPSSAPPGTWGDQHGAAWADIDKDGFKDLLVLVGAHEGKGANDNQLFLNKAGRLVDAAAALKVTNPLSRARTPLWIDYDNDGKVDLFQGAKRRPDGQGPPTMFRRTGSTFTDVRKDVGFLPTNSLSAWASDVNRDGRLELLYQGSKLASPKSPVATRLDIIDTRGSTFRNVTPVSFRGGMSDVAVADYDGDLRPDFFLCNVWRPGATPVGHDLYLNRAGGFVRASGAVLAQINRFQRPCPPSALAADFDNDMDVDIVLQGGHPNVAVANTILWNRGDGTFVADGTAGGAAGRQKGGADSVSAADYDVDGFIDLFLTYNRQTTQLYRNRGNGNHWLEIRLKGTRSNAEGIGAQVYVTAGGKAQLREQTGGMHRYWSQNDQTVHFGLGANTRAASVRVEWPSGTVQGLTNVRADQVLTLTEPR